MKFVLAATAWTLASAVTDWNYDNKDEVFGPESWVNTYPDCGRLRQSPINIKGKFTTYKKTDALPDYTFTGLPEKDTTSAFTLTNTGTTLEITGDVMEGVILSGGGMDKDYVLSKIHLHWAKSEHEIGGDKQEAEVQFIFEDRAGDPDVAEGRLHLAVMVDSQKKANKELSPLFDGLDGITAVNDDTEVVFDINELLPKKWNRDYWTYAGSLTTPPCTQNVQWVICRNYIQFGKSQLRALRSLLSSLAGSDSGDVKKLTLENNYRPIQKLNSRHIFKSFKGQGGTSSNSQKLEAFEDMLNGDSGASSFGGFGSFFG